MILTVTLNPAVDKTATLQQLKVNELNRIDNVIMDAGGKGINVSKTIQALQGESVATGFVAGSNGQFIIDTLNELSIKHDMLKVSGNTRTNLKILDAEMELTEINEVGATIKAHEITALKNKIMEMIKADDIVVLSGSAPKGVPKTIYYDFISSIKEKHAYTILDADAVLFQEGIKAIPSVIKPNKHELCEYFNVGEDIEEKELLRLSQKLLDLGIELVVVSMGKDGSYFVSQEKIARVEAIKIDANSSVGAGDAMVAALAFAKEASLCFEETIRLAVACSSGAVLTKGTQPASKEVVDTLKEKVKIHFIKE